MPQPDSRTANPSVSAVEAQLLCRLMGGPMAMCDLECWEVEHGAIGIARSLAERGSIVRDEVAGVVRLDTARRLDALRRLADAVHAMPVVAEPGVVSGRP